MGTSDARDRGPRPIATPPIEVVAGGAHAAAKLDRAKLCTEAIAGLKQMGWRPAIAHAAVTAAASALGADATLERVLVEALRRCPQPRWA